MAGGVFRSARGAAIAARSSGRACFRRVGATFSSPASSCDSSLDDCGEDACCAETVANGPATKENSSARKTTMRCTVPNVLRRLLIPRPYAYSAHVAGARSISIIELSLESTDHAVLLHPVDFPTRDVE